MKKIHCFSLQFEGLVSSLPVDIKVARAYDPAKTLAKDIPPLMDYQAIWDTGATNSVITNKVVTDCGLKISGYRNVHGVHGLNRTNAYLVNIRLPNTVGFVGVSVTEGKLPDDSEVLIGMDIISQGDFTLTHPKGKTLFSFRYPSIGHIDFVKKMGFASIGSKNQSCPCGSGKKLKNCCAK